MRAILLLAFAATIANAASITWTGFGHDGQWTNPLNWNDDKVPGQSDDVLIPVGNVLCTAPVSVNSLVMGTQVSGTANLTLFQSFVIGNGGMQVEENGNLIINTGMSTVFGQVTIGGNLVFVDGIISGAWTINDRASADLGNANQKGFSGAAFISKGQLSLGGVIVLNQSSTITLQSATAANTNLFIQAGDTSVVEFDASAATFTYSTGLLQVQAPVTFGDFVLNSGNVSVLASLTFAKSLNIPANSYVSAAGTAVLNMSAGATGAGVLSLASSKPSYMYGLDMSGYVNALGGSIVFETESSVGVLTIDGGDLAVVGAIKAGQLNLLGGTTAGTGLITATNVLVSTHGLTLNSPVSATSAVTVKNSVLTFAADGRLSLGENCTTTVTEQLMFTGGPNGKGVTNNGLIVVNAAMESQNIPIMGSGSMELAASLGVSQVTFTQSTVTLKNTVIGGTNTYLTIGAVKSSTGGLVSAQLGGYKFACPGECEHITTPDASKPAPIKFSFSG